MKDAVITVRLPRLTRSRIERLARVEGRSLSQQVERLIETALAAGAGSPEDRPHGARPLAGTLSGDHVPTLAELRSVRAALSRALERRSRGRADAGR
jgi:hypothetical protein